MLRQTGMGCGQRCRNFSGHGKRDQLSLALYLMSTLTSEDLRRGCTPFLHPARSSSGDKWYILGSGPMAGIYQNWQICQLLKGNLTAEKCGSLEEAFAMCCEICLAVHSHANLADFDSFQDPSLTAGAGSPGIPSLGLVRGMTNVRMTSSPTKAHASSPPKPCPDQASMSHGVQPLQSPNCSSTKAGKSTWRARVLAPATYYVVRSERSAFQCSDSIRARTVYEEALHRGEDVEMLVTNDEHEYRLYGYLRPLVFKELERMKLKNDKNPFHFPSTFPEPNRRLYSYLLEPERSEPDWNEWIHALSAMGCPADWTREDWLDAWRSMGSAPDWTCRVMIRFPWDIQYIEGGYAATVKFSYAAYDEFHDVIFLHPVSVVIEEDRVVEYAIDGIEVTMSFPEEEE
ncbi:hypothetical protein C8J56DRAFT_900762 [Mycena floridula]|nr:hypothetical protein C8J56DRAFT_900762 [Mycena floridula]